MNDAFAICKLSIAPVRSSASHRSEMRSQLLFGEVVRVLETKDRQWAHILQPEDGFSGWVATNQLRAITAEEAEHYQTDFAFALELYQPILARDHFLPVSFGARLPAFDGMHFRFGEERYTFSGQAVFAKDIAPKPELVIKLARKLLNVPFLWGGRTPLGIDAPALVQLAFQVTGVNLPRTVEAQVNCGEPVDFVQQSQAADLAFFDALGGRVNHTGLILPGSRILHCYERVRIDAIDHYGIYNFELGRYTHRLRIVKRLLPDAPAPVIIDQRVDQEQEPQMAMF
jgi:cell wall-associated NlpC family hydrolase